MAVNESVTILLVEDDLGHARLIEKNLRRSGVSNKIIHLDNGQKAVDYLLPCSDIPDTAYSGPMLVLLDINMPVVNGLQVLQIIKTNPKTSHIPVVMLTTTDTPEEISKCYELGCNAYVTKPVEYEQFCEAIRNLGLLLSVVKIPDEH